MTLPGFTADASLYRTMNLYRSGISANTSTGPRAGLVSPQLDCGLICFGEFLACAAGCAFLDPLCDAGCAITYGLCLANCPSSGGGGGGGPPPCCPLGTSCRCGGRCVPGKGCIGGACLRPGESCQ